MSTRATYEFRDGRGAHTVYQHHDGYPAGGLQWIANAIPLAWPLPRFEADEFAASFIAGNKDRGGSVRLTRGRDAHGDTQFHYVVSMKDRRLHIEIFAVDYTGAGRSDWRLLEEGGLHELLEKHAPEMAWLSPPALEALAK